MNSIEGAEGGAEKTNATNTKITTYLRAKSAAAVDADCHHDDNDDEETATRRTTQHHNRNGGHHRRYYTTVYY